MPMKRKIRQKQQLHIQKDKENKRRKKWMTECNSLEERRCLLNDFASIAESPEYLYVYVNLYPGYGISSASPGTIVFLFDINNEFVRYAEEIIEFLGTEQIELNNHEILEMPSKMVVSLNHIGEAYFNIKNEIDEMFEWEEPEDPYIHDGPSGGYTLFLKNGERKRWFYIKKKKYYLPYLWLLRFYQDVLEMKNKEDMQ